MPAKKITPIPEKETVASPATATAAAAPSTKAEMTLKMLLIPSAIIIAGGLIGLSIFLSSVYQSRSTDNNPQVAGQRQVANEREEGDNQTLAKNTAPITDRDHIRGPRTAEVTLVEYSDLDCPFCKQVHPTLQKLQREYGGRLAWVYRHFPLSAIHPTAEHKAEAAECVAELAGGEGFWKFVDLLFSEAAATDAQLATLAETAGAQKNSFQSCLKSGKYKARIAEDLDNGVKSGVSGTPHSILIHNGKFVALRGAVPEQNFKSAIDALLAE